MRIWLRTAYAAALTAFALGTPSANAQSRFVCDLITPAPVICMSSAKLVGEYNGNALVVDRADLYGWR